MKTMIKTALFSLFAFVISPNIAHTLAEVNFLEQMGKIQAEAKKQADEHATELTRLQLIFNNQKKPKKSPILPGAKKYKKKYRTVDADLKELTQAIQNDVNKLLAPLPLEATEKKHMKYRDLLISFGNNAKRTLKALRDEMKWLRGEKEAKFEVFENYEAADKFLLLK